MASGSASFGPWQPPPPLVRRGQVGQDGWMSGEPMPAPKEPRWWLRMLLGLMAFFLLVTVGIGVAVYRWGNRPENREKLGAVSDLMKIGLEAATAPGTAELRALGCKNAVVIDAEQVNKVTQRLEGRAGTGDGGATAEEREMVSLICGVAAGKAVRCDQVVATYVQAVTNPPEKLFVVVQEERGRKEPLCEGLYDRTGQLLEAVEEEAE